MATTEVDEPRRARRIPAQEVVPFGWESPTAPPPRDSDDEALFRFPAADDPTPGTRRLLAMSVYASALGLAGVGVGVRGLLSQLSGGLPGWYVPVLALLGMVSVVLSVGAFLSIHRRVLPWVLLLAAGVPLAVDVLLAVSY